VRFNCLFGAGSAKVNRETVSPGVCVRGVRQRQLLAIALDFIECIIDLLSMGSAQNWEIG
jgi:hypothetical protein